MWDLLTSREARAEHVANRGRSVVTGYSAEVMAAERASAARGLCTEGQFELNARQSDGAALRRALDFFMASAAPDELNDSWSLHKSLLVFLRGVSAIPWVLTVGWYEFGIRQYFRHAPETAMAALKEPRPIRHRTVHTWLTSRFYELIDAAMPALLDPTEWRTRDRNLAFFHTAPVAAGALVYHPTIIVSDRAEHPVALGSRADGNSHQPDREASS